MLKVLLCDCHSFQLLFQTNIFKLGKSIDKEVLKLSPINNKNKFTLTCIADNGVDSVLRKTITVLVSGECYLIEIKRFKLNKLILEQNVAHY